MCEKLTIFPYGQDIVGNVVLLAFWGNRQVQDRSWGLWNICKSITLMSGADHCTFDHSSKASSVPWNQVFRWKVSRGKLRDEISGDFIVCDIRQGANMFCQLVIKSPLMIIYTTCAVRSNYFDRRWFLGSGDYSYRLCASMTNSDCSVMLTVVVYWLFAG